MYFRSSRTEGGPFSSETDLQFTELSLISINIQKNFRKIIFKVFKAISTPLKLLLHFFQRVIGLYNFIEINKIAKRKSKFKSYENLQSEP